MAKGKDQLFGEAQAAGLVAADANADDFTVAELSAILNPGDRPAWEGSLSATEPLVAPDGHVVLSQDDLDRQAADAAA